MNRITTWRAICRDLTRTFPPSHAIWGTNQNIETTRFSVKVPFTYNMIFIYGYTDQYKAVASSYDLDKVARGISKACVEKYRNSTPIAEALRNTEIIIKRIISSDSNNYIRKSSKNKTWDYPVFCKYCWRLTPTDNRYPLSKKSNLCHIHTPQTKEYQQSRRHLKYFTSSYINIRQNSNKEIKKNPELQSIFQSNIQKVLIGISEIKEIDIMKIAMELDIKNEEIVDIENIAKTTGASIKTVKKIFDDRKNPPSLSQMKALEKIYPLTFKYVRDEKNKNPYHWRQLIEGIIEDSAPIEDKEGIIAIQREINSMIAIPRDAKKFLTNCEAWLAIKASHPHGGKQPGAGRPPKKAFLKTTQCLSKHPGTTKGQQ